MYQFMLLKINQEVIKSSACLQTAFGVKKHPEEGQWPEEQMNMLKLLMFRV
jgi:hypothetical protein